MATKRKRNAGQVDDVLAPKKTLLQEDTQNNNDHNGNIAKAAESRKTNAPKKLPDEVLQQFLSEPGKLLIAGNVSMDRCGKSNGEKREELHVFSRFTDKKYRAIVSGPVSAHSVLIDEDLKAFSFGRSQLSQCGHKKLQTFNKPQLIQELKHVNIITAACGRGHTLFLSDTGAVYACGDNKSGQLGIGKKTALIKEPIRISYSGPPICKIGCGAEFSVILDVDGNLHTFGHPDMGQLGHGTDGKFFNEHNKLVFAMQYYPQQITSFIEKSKEGRPIPISNVKIVDFACGKNHTIAIDSEKRAFSFGFGGFGRLGHNEPRDESIPRLIKYLNMRVTGGASRVYCGSTFSLAISGHNNPYLFGKNQNTPGGEGQMYPKIVDTLCGFQIKSVGCSLSSIVLACGDNGSSKLIAWGSSPTYGELGIGSKPKSSTKPTFVDAMDGVNVSQVAMGQEHTLLLVNNNDLSSDEKYLVQPEYIPKDEKTSD